MKAVTLALTLVVTVATQEKVDPNSEVEIVGPPVERNPYPGDLEPGLGVSVARIPFPLLIRALLGNINRDSPFSSSGSEFPNFEENVETSDENPEEPGRRGVEFLVFFLELLSPS